MGFHEIRFPTSISRGANGGPERRTSVVALVSGHEVRNQQWADSRRHYDAGSGIKTADQLHEVVAFFEARRGRAHGFRWKDWSDYRSCPPLLIPAPDDQEIGTGDGSQTQFPLIKIYSPGLAPWMRAIRKPVGGSVRVAVDGLELAEGDGFTVDATTGLVTLAEAPTGGATVSAGYEFDVPVRFDTDRLDINLHALDHGEIPVIPVIEIRG